MRLSICSFFKYVCNCLVKCVNDGFYKSLSDNSNTSVIRSWPLLIVFFFIQFEIFLFLGTRGDFGLKCVHFYVML